ncbi:uncharacterized protein LOC134286384 [Aedes albopictus]|uniref:Integrase catalytic domain-containing protein n=1 Tax=Aedes albopictus TaxID=7160 RepID=A0ABM1Y4B4_AEDAL
MPEPARILTTTTEIDEPAREIPDQAGTFLLDRFSSFGKLQRAVAYMLRFINNCRDKHQRALVSERLSVCELDAAQVQIIKITQQRYFDQEIKNIRKNGCVANNSSLVTLHPFLDDNGLLRVGGRIQAAGVTYDQKHPLVLPSKCSVTQLIATDTHRKNLHVGPQGLLYAMRLKYWPIHGKQLARQVVHRCITCFKNKPKPLHQIMGQVPDVRLYPGRPKTIPTLRRFSSQRGRSSIIHCDNGTNFVGTKNELDAIAAKFDAEVSPNIKSFCAAEGIEWKFIPPRAPNFGGIWEAGIKSVKHHMKRVLGTKIPTYEEMLTLLKQIEGCLNSRPISPMSTDPDDTSPLTPGHFLIGGPIIALPDKNVSETPANRLTRFEEIQKTVQLFWKRWRAEYLNNLQQRTKAMASSPVVNPIYWLDNYA